MSERRACKLMGMDRSSYRYEPRPDRNTKLREALLTLARQKRRHGYRRLHALLERDQHAANVMRLYRLYRAEGLAVRRQKRRRLTRVALASQLVHRNDFCVRHAGKWPWHSYHGGGGCLHPRKPFLTLEVDSRIMQVN